MKDLQFVNWFPEWHGFRFIKGIPLKEHSAFHLIYKWSFHFGFWEIRKFLSDTKRTGIRPMLRYFQKSRIYKIEKA